MFLLLHLTIWDQIYSCPLTCLSQSLGQSWMLVQNTNMRLEKMALASGKEVILRYHSYHVGSAHADTPFP